MPETTLEQDFDTELNRLTARGIPDDELEIARRYYSQKERESMSSSSFCGPHRSFPVTSQADVDNAAHLVGHADNPDAVKACIKRKAKASGWKLPASWTDGSGSKDRALTTDIEQHMYVPITRIDKDEWLVEGQATSDAIDAYGTIFDYDSSKRAFQTWRGNIREMHDPKKAVGRAIEVMPDDENHLIAIRARISKGARDTWEKVQDGTLSGFSIGVPKDKYKLKTVERNGKSVPVYYDHELAEVSLVDNPGSPGCNVTVVRGDGIATEVLDDTQPSETDLTRSGAKISHATQSDLHSLRDGHFQHAKKTMQICACDECNGVMTKMDPDGDGDNDLVPSMDWDNDGGTQNMLGPGVPGRVIEAEIGRHMQPLLLRMQAILTQHIQQPQHIPTPTTDPEVTRHIEAMETRFHSELGEVRSMLVEVKGLAEKIANTPLPGGPVATPVPVDKRLATQPQGQGYNPQNDIAAITRAAELGLFKDQDSQVNAAAAIIARQRSQGS